jgi:hypothetical protein
VTCSARPAPSCRKPSSSVCGTETNHRQIPVHVSGACTVLRSRCAPRQRRRRERFAANPFRLVKKWTRTLALVQRDGSPLATIQWIVGSGPALIDNVVTGGTHRRTEISLTWFSETLCHSPRAAGAYDCDWLSNWAVESSAPCVSLDSIPHRVITSASRHVPRGEVAATPSRRKTAFSPDEHAGGLRSDIRRPATLRDRANTQIPPRQVREIRHARVR